MKSLKETETSIRYSEYITGKEAGIQFFEKRKEIWKNAFPLGDYIPPLKKPEIKEKRLAEQFCPILLVDPNLMAEELCVLRKQLGMKEEGVGKQNSIFKFFPTNVPNVAESIFLFSVGEFPDDLAGAKLMILSQVLPIMRKYPDDVKRKKAFQKYLAIAKKVNAEKKSAATDKGFKIYARKMVKAQKKYLRLLLSSQNLPSKLPVINRHPELQRMLVGALTSIEGKKFDLSIDWLFDLIFPTKCTCKIKYRVLQHPKNSAFFCIQYFAYWPMQLFPWHYGDYEPIFVYVYRTAMRYEPLLVVFNANCGGQPLLKGKRPGHLIRTYFNWELLPEVGRSISQDPVQISPEFFNQMARYMTDAYGGEYKYHEYSGANSYDDSSIDRVFFEGRPMLFVPNTGLTKWHAFEEGLQAIEEKPERREWKIECKLEPLKAADLLHIEWDILDPFKAPFLHPIIGEKNKLMHHPLDVSVLFDLNSFQDWSAFAAYEFFLKFGKYSEMAAKIAEFRGGLLMEMLAMHSQENPDFNFYRAQELFWKYVKKPALAVVGHSTLTGKLPILTDYFGKGMGAPSLNTSLFYKDRSIDPAKGDQYHIVVVDWKAKLRLWFKYRFLFQLRKKFKSIAKRKKSEDHAE
jgi:hypothetical protein